MVARVSLALCRPLRWRRMRYSEKWRPYRCPRITRALPSSCETSTILHTAASGSLGETLSLQSSAYNTAGHGCVLIHTRSPRPVPYLQGHSALANSHSCATGCVEHCTIKGMPRERIVALTILPGWTAQRVSSAAGSLRGQLRCTAQRQAHGQCQGSRLMICKASWSA